MDQSWKAIEKIDLLGFGLVSSPSTGNEEALQAARVAAKDLGDAQEVEELLQAGAGWGAANHSEPICKTQGWRYEAFINSLFIDVLFISAKSLFGISESSLKHDVDPGPFKGRGMWRDPGSLCTAVFAAGAEAINPAYAIDFGRCLRRDLQNPSNRWGFSGKDRKYLEVLNEAMAGSATWSTSLLKISGNSHFGVLITKVRSFIFFSFSHRTPPKSNCMKFLFTAMVQVGWWGPACGCDKSSLAWTQESQFGV